MQVLILGNGNHTKKRILPALKSIRSIENIVIADKNTENKEKIDSKLEIRNFNKELKNNEEYNLIVIATPPYNHKNSLLDVVNKSNNILVEKPISNDINFIFDSEFKDLKNKFNIFESLMYFHHPLWSKVKDIIKENKIIKIFSEFSVPHLQDNNYVYSKKLGGGSLFDQGIYPVSLASDHRTRNPTPLAARGRASRAQPRCVTLGCAQLGGPLARCATGRLSLCRCECLIHAEARLHLCLCLCCSLMSCRCSVDATL